MKYICVFCGSSESASEKYKQIAEELGKKIVDMGFGLVYGGGNIGLMNIVANSVLSAGGKVIGVVTDEIIAMEVVHSKLTEVITTESYSKRKAKMMSLSPGFIALPGGYGTMDELAQVLINNQFANSKKSESDPVKPCTILNIDGFYDGFIMQLNRSKNDGWITENHYKMLFQSNDVDELVKYIADFKEPEICTDRWWEKEEKNISVQKFSRSCQII